ncbi:MAG TPA: ergothioneine biosynthesis glutamate--cysteine ligase EgtA [Jatrophihabitantaceae bacterium]|nr:ergothioneine biosynthesis glutamate--cysteine ligase EgtA [Jatrophihabitantaceae bacterium]
MNAHRTATLPPAVTITDIETARTHIATTALVPSSTARVGLELEFHVVDVTAPLRRPTWNDINAIVAAAGSLPCGSAITTEPGGQLELSGPPHSGVGFAIAALQTDERALRTAARRFGLGLAPIGADPARALARVTPVSRYAAMEQHFAALGCGGAGRQMMASTAALQVNLDAGPSRLWGERLDHLHRIGPVLSAISACSPMIAGRRSGWASMREQAWRAIDHARTGPLRRSNDPAGSWADYALAAPVMLVRDGEQATPVTTRVPLREWIRTPDLLDRAPTLDDVDYHLTTLFPPIRLRGYLELRFLDAVPDQWWPALAAITATLVDDATAAGEAAEACAHIDHGWGRAAREGLRRPDLHAAARRCVAIAASRCPESLRPAVAAYAELVDRGETPGTQLAHKISETAPEDAFVDAAQGDGDGDRA